MKCEVCLELLEEYLDGELEPQAQAQVGEHLIECAGCSASFAGLSAEQQLFARYNRELEVPPFLWTRVAAHTVAGNNSPRLNGWAAIIARPLARVIAVLLLAIAVAVAVPATSHASAIGGTVSWMPRATTELPAQNSIVRMSSK